MRIGRRMAMPLAGLLCACEPVAQEDVEVAAAEGSEVAGTPLEADLLLNWGAQNLPDSGWSLDFAVYDLDGDGGEELLGYFSGGTICGSGGCNLVVLEEDGSERGRLTVSKRPIGVFASETNGWRDLAVTIGGGGMAAGPARVPFDGERYASNPTVAPAERSEAPFEVLIEQPQLRPEQIDQ